MRLIGLTGFLAVISRVLWFWNEFLLMSDREAHMQQKCAARGGILVGARDGGKPIESQPRRTFLMCLFSSCLAVGAHTTPWLATGAVVVRQSDPFGITLTQGSIKEVDAGLSNKIDNPATGLLRVLPDNPRYFTDGSGKAVYLVGSHTWTSLQDFSGVSQPFNYAAYIRFMVSHHFNFMRMWTSWITHADVTGEPCCEVSGPFPWVRTGPGAADDDAPRFDFSRFDEEYFRRLRLRVVTAGANGIYVAIMLFNGFEFQFAGKKTRGNPFDGTNNVNSVNCGGSCPTDSRQMPAVVWRYEQAYIRKVVDTVNDLDNVLYEVANEAGAPYSTGWQANVIDYVKQYEATKPEKHPVGMTFQYRGGTDEALYKSQADWISPSSRLPSEANGDKVVINDTDHSFYYTAMLAAGQNGQRNWAWGNFARGYNIAFMDPYQVNWPGRNAPDGTGLDPYWNELRRAMSDTRSYATKIDLVHMTPRRELVDIGADCLANPGSQYLVFVPSPAHAPMLGRIVRWISGSSFTITLVPGKYAYEWFDPSSHAVAETGNITVDAKHTFSAPFSGPSVLWLHR
jgi:hypothetical protein